MTMFLPGLIGLPLLGVLLTLFAPEKNERWIARVVIGSLVTQLLASCIFVVGWLMDGHPVYEVKEWVLYSTADYEFFIELYFDRITAVYLLTGSFLTFLIAVYSRYYLHREKGYKRFFSTLLLFYLGYNITIFSGNFETLFLGWEILGISSFLLIAFYRNRYLPVKNAMKVFSLYRLGDIGLILAMWLTHHLWHHNITFSELNNAASVDLHLQEQALVGLASSLLIVLAATVKSAQFPFSSWLPRAMEGPTPSSAIFYSALSVHIGAFILMRTFPFWEHQPFVRAVVLLIGQVTVVLASMTTRVQSSVKAQVAYAGIAQIGFIFMEISLGLELLALIHFAGNAFLRGYQLLVSPSVVTYLVREQFYHFSPHIPKKRWSWITRLSNTLYILSLKEWNLDSIQFYYLWSPLKRVGDRLGFINRASALYFFFPLFIAGCILLLNQELIPVRLRAALPVVFSAVGLLLSLKSFVKRFRAKLVWLLIFQNHLWIALAITFNASVNYSDTGLYLSGILASGILGMACLLWLERREQHMDLNSFHGYSARYKTPALLFLLACLGMAGFPITPAFIGEDLVFSHIQVNQLLLLLFVAFSFIINGLALIRIYARLFMGPRSNSDHPVAERSA